MSHAFSLLDFELLISFDFETRVHRGYAFTVFRNWWLASVDGNRW